MMALKMLTTKYCWTATTSSTYIRLQLAERGSLLRVAGSFSSLERARSDVETIARKSRYKVSVSGVPRNKSVYADILGWTRHIAGTICMGGGSTKGKFRVMIHDRFPGPSILSCHKWNQGIRFAFFVRTNLDQMFRVCKPRFGDSRPHDTTSLQPAAKPPRATPEPRVCNKPSPSPLNPKGPGLYLV